MDMTDIVKMGTEMFQEKLGDQAANLDSDTITDALSGLISNEEGGFDLSNIISSVTSGEGGLGSIVSSWLGNGENAAVDGSQLTDLFGDDQISAFAEKLGIAPGIVVGRLQHDEVISYSAANRLKKRFRFREED